MDNKPVTKLAQTSDFVKSTSKLLTTHSLDSMIHHNVLGYFPSYIVVTYKNMIGKPYGVSPAFRVLSPQLLLKKFDYVRDSLENILGLTLAQREVTLRLLRLWAYYGYVYPKEATITEQPGCSKATFWRTIRILRDLGLIHIINRHVIRPHSQISNLYRLDRLVLLLARYLAEHGCPFYEKWLEPYLRLPLRTFESIVYQTPEARAGPGALAS